MSDLLRCDRCKYWEAPDKDEWCPVRAVMGRCARTPHIEDMKEWFIKGDDTLDIIKIEYLDRSAATYDASGYASGLRTRPEHFCAMFKEQSND